MKECFLSEDFKKRMYERRCELGLTIEMAAAFLDVDTSTYWYWEKGGTRSCASDACERLRHFVHGDIAMLGEEIARKMKIEDPDKALEDCLCIVSQVCCMVQEDNEALENYTNGVQGILVDTFCEHLLGCEAKA